MYLLNNGLKIPKVGFGTWKATDKEQCKNAVKTALEIGYRHIDTDILIQLLFMEMKML